MTADKLDRRSRAAKASLWAVGFTDAVAIPAGLAYAVYLQSQDPFAKVEDLDLALAETAYALAGLAQVVALITSAIFFIRWFHLAHRDLPSLSDRPATHDSRWAIWGFFVPLLNLVRPQQLMRETWSITSDAWDANPSRVVGLTRPRDCVNRWWGFFLATNVLGNMVGRATWRAETVLDTLWATWATTFADAFDIVAAFAALALVRAVTALQRPLLGHAPKGPAA